MNKIAVQVYVNNIACLCGHNKLTPVYLSVVDFYEGFDLFICPVSHELFALDRERVKYLRKSFAELVSNKECPGCTAPLDKLLPYPQYYICRYCKQLQHLDRPQEDIPATKTMETISFYDLLS